MNEFVNSLCLSWSCRFVSIDCLYGFVSDNCIFECCSILSFQYCVDLMCVNFFSFVCFVFSFGFIDVQNWSQVLFFQYCEFFCDQFVRFFVVSMMFRVVDDDVLCVDVFQYSSRGFIGECVGQVQVYVLCIQYDVVVFSFVFCYIDVYFWWCDCNCIVSNICQFFMQVRNQFVNYVVVVVQFLVIYY